MRNEGSIVEGWARSIKGAAISAVSGRLCPPWSTHRWPVAPVASITGLRSVEIDLGGGCARRPATVVGAPEPIAAEFALHECTSIVPPRCHIAEIARARVLDGVVATSDGTILAESLVNLAAGERPSWPPDQRRLTTLRRHRHVLLKQRFDSNYGHWLVEALPRLALVQERYDLRDLRFIVSGWHGATMSRVYADSLALFGIRPAQIVEIGIGPVVVRRLVYPTPMTKHAWQIAPRCVEVLATMASRVPAAAAQAGRLYVSRGMGANRRRLLNEDAILALARARGFTIVEPATMSLYEQIALFRGARHVVGPYGAALTNVAFADEPASLLALTSPWMQDDFFSTLLSLTGGRYASLHGAAVDGCQDRDADFRIDPDRFAAMLDAMLAG